MIWLAYVISIIYVAALLWLLFGYKQLLLFLRKNTTPSTLFSVVVVFRNEVENLPLLLQSIEQLKYPKEAFEILFVDDASSDGSSEVIHSFFKNLPNFNYQVIENIQTTAAPKKDAITLAISKATHDWIVTTDADCQVVTHWLQRLNDFIKTEDPVCVAGPVIFKNSGSFIQQYQHYDGLSLQMVAQGGFGHQLPLVCNGANFSYKKEAFYAVHGFEGNAHLVSGDDVFLLEKMQAQYPNKVRFLKSPDAIVTTLPVLSWDALLQQRIRWASKSSYQQNTTMKLLGGIVVLQNLLVVFAAFMALAALISWTHLFAILLMKLVIDAVVLWKTKDFYTSKISVVSFIGCFLIYPWLTVLVIAKSMTGKITWKDRLFQNKHKASKEI